MKTAAKQLSWLLSLCIILGMFSGAVSALETTQEIDQMIANMTDEEKIGQKIMAHIRTWNNSDFTVMNEEVADYLQKFHLGGMILFAVNITGTEQVTRLNDGMQQAALQSDTKIPLLIGVDQEGGRVTRLNSGTAMPGNMALGATMDPKSAYQVGTVLGAETGALGFNVNFAPSLDVNNNPENPVIGLRSISDNPALVASLGTELVNGIQSQGVSAAVKHFAGHGDTATDSHYGLPEVNKSLDELNKVELVPFRAAMRNGVDMLMTAHIMFPQLDSELPATLSRNILTDLVRTDMQYDGVIITDAMEMQAISENFGEADATVKAFAAGVDIALMPTSVQSVEDFSKMDAIVQAVKAALTDGTLNRKEFDASVKRILQLKYERGVMDYENKDVESLVSHAKQTVGSAQHRTIERTVAANAITVLENNNNLLPFQPTSDQRVLLIGAGGTTHESLSFGFNRLRREGVLPEGISFDTAVYHADTTTTDVADIQAQIAQADYIVLTVAATNPTQMKPAEWQTSIPLELLDYAQNADKPIVVASAGLPYEVANFHQKADAMLVAYGNREMGDPTESGAVNPSLTYGPNLPAILDVVFGGADMQGRLPVNIPVIQDGKMDPSEYIYEYGYGITTIASVDKSDLDQLYTQLMGLNLRDYEAGQTKQAFRQALADAQAVLSNDQATTQQVQNAYQALDQAHQALIKLNRDDLIRLIDQAQQIESVLHQYQAQGQQEFVVALQAARDAIAADDITQHEIDHALAQLSQAMQALQRLSNDDPADSSASDSSTATAAPVNTADNIHTLIILTSLLGATALLLYLYHRKKGQ